MNRLIPSLAVFASMWLGSPPAWASGSDKYSKADGDQHSSEFSTADLCGSYGFSFDGSAGDHIVAVGLLNFDGRGNMSGERTLNIGVAVLQQTFTCTYEVRANGTGGADCIAFIDQDGRRKSPASRPA